MKRAALYARVSSDAQAGEDRTSLQEQMADMKAHCSRKGYTVAETYQDIGSGTSRKRPDFQRMLADGRAGRFDIIVCWKGDRLSRGMYPAAALMEVVDVYQIRLEAVMDAIDTSNFPMLAAVGKMELDNLRERSRMGKRGAAKRGRVPSGRNLPFGYRSDCGVPVIHEEEAQVVRTAFDLYVGGFSTPAVAMALQEMTGREWPDSRLAKLLGKSAYVGEWRYGESRVTQTENGRVRTATPDEAIKVEFPSIVDRETWDRVQQLKAERRRRSLGSTRMFYLLQHLVRCGQCGSLMGGQTKNQGRNRYYRCRGQKRFKISCREKSYIRAADLEAVVWQEVVKLLQDPAAILAGLSPDQNDRTDEELKDAERDLRKVQTEEDRLIRLYVVGELTDDQLARQRRFITERVEHLQNRVNELRARRSAGQSQEEAARTLAEWAEQIGRGLDGLDDQGRKEVVRDVLDGATLDGDNNLTLRVLAPTPPASPCAPV